MAGLLQEHSYTRLNTRKPRSAFFEFDLDGRSKDDTSPAILSIEGLQGLLQLCVEDSLSSDQWEQIADSIPREVTPMVTLSRPMQLVTTAGADTKSGTEAFESSLAAMKELVPLAKVLGFTSIETYVRWNWVEPEEGIFDWRYVDPLVQEIRRYDMKWFPLLIVGSAYALPQWFRGSQEDVGFVCLEHGISNPIQSIWNPSQKRHVTRFLQAFGSHYEPMGVLEGVRLGPSGNFGESQFPAGGNWAAPGENKMHIHIGWWAGDRFAGEAYRQFLRKSYKTIADLNAAWELDYPDFESVSPRLPENMLVPRERLDFTEWYTDSMSEWCDWWVREAGKALPHTKIYQSASGWGFRESGTDYTAQAKSMIQVHGGIRLTNETDSFEQNFFATRLAATAARLYGIDLGYEPASSHTARGVVGRLFETAVTNADHFFTYDSNVIFHPLAISKWLSYLKVLDERQDPLVEVAVYYPETTNQLEDAAFRYLYAWGFNPRAREIRRSVEVDYLDDRLIREGFLDRYKVLAFAWGDVLEEDVLEKIDEWVKSGGGVIYPSFPRGSVSTVEGDTHIFRGWQSGRTGKGSFYRFAGDMEPPSDYGDFVLTTLRGVSGLSPWTHEVLEAEHSEKVFCSIQQDGHLMILNYADKPGFLKLGEGTDVTIEPYGIERIPLAP